jgi:hypothetical protein
MELVESQKMSLLQKAADIAMQAASTGKFSSDAIADIIEKSYKKMLQLAKED